MPFCCQFRHLIVICALALVCACASQTEFLNSDRIERRFGSYGVEVLWADDAQRISNLYSNEADGRICRTFAVVRFELPLDTRIEVEHSQVVAGASIGQVFRGAGWRIDKTSLEFGTARAADFPDLPMMMRIQPTTVLATYEYRFDVIRDGLRIPYATITEFYHPDYLSLTELQAMPH
ncbi:MAG: hypothetical protein OEW68_03545 [Gammaproteobacteria bacterium]|nr:hypothetical protein [Gammaproteobacteria bacterium]